MLIYTPYVMNDAKTSLQAQEYRGKAGTGAYFLIWHGKVMCWSVGQP